MVIPTDAVLAHRIKTRITYLLAVLFPRVPLCTTEALSKQVLLAPSRRSRAHKAPLK
jgi:hypothetical protein